MVFKNLHTLRFTLCAVQFHEFWEMLTSHIHLQVGENFLPVWTPSPKVHGVKLLVFCSSSYSANQEWGSAREAFSIYFLRPVICYDLSSRVHSICQSSRDNLSGELLFRLFSNLGWQQAVGIALSRVEEKKTSYCSTFVAILFLMCWIILRELVLWSQTIPIPLL